MKAEPSGGELISAATETAPLPPGLFSITTDWPTFSCSRRADDARDRVRQPAGARRNDELDGLAGISALALRRRERERAEAVAASGQQHGAAMSKHHGFLPGHWIGQHTRFINRHASAGTGVISPLISAPARTP